MGRKFDETYLIIRNSRLPKGDCETIRIRKNGRLITHFWDNIHKRGTISAIGNGFLYHEKTNEKLSFRKLRELEMAHVWTTKSSN